MQFRAIFRLYVSLYGIENVSEIESEFFKQLHPILASKKMVLTGKIAKGLLKSTFKIDLDNDGKPDGTVSPKNPDIKLPEYLTNTSDFVLIFDDLERVSMDIESILGYINHFVEHQGYKVIIIANEDEILSYDKENQLSKKGKLYLRIKEKLIGKTFEIIPTPQSVLTNFLSKTKNEDFYREHADLICAYHKYSGYENFRHLKQALWDFDRFKKELPQKAIDKPEVLLHIFKFFLIFSFEIKKGSITAQEIPSMRRGYLSSIMDVKEKEKSENPIKAIWKKYPNTSFYDTLLQDSIWVDFFDKGFIDAHAINESIEKSSYFVSENTPNWAKLWHALELSDEEFDLLLVDVSQDYNKKEFKELGVVKHVTGLLLWFSELKLYNKSEKEILDFAKEYIDQLKNEGNLPPCNPNAHHFIDNDAWGGLGFVKKDSESFKELCRYIKENEEKVTHESYPEKGKELLDLIKSDPDLFYRRIILSNHEDNIYYDTPILKYIDPEEFVKVFMAVQPSVKRRVCLALQKRYEILDVKPNLRTELDWFQEVISLLEKERKALQGKISGTQLDLFLTESLNQALIFLKGDNT